MDQQHVAVCLGVGGGAPMDQQQGAGSGELATVTGVMSGQGVGSVIRWAYVYHVDIFSRNALSAATRGAFRVCDAKITGVLREVAKTFQRSWVVPHNVEIQQCSLLWRAFSPATEVYDVLHIAGWGRGCKEESRPCEAAPCLVGQATFRVAPQRCPLSSPDASKVYTYLHPCSWSISTNTTNTIRPNSTRSR